LSTIYLCSQIEGRIDQMHQVLELNNTSQGANAASRYMALKKWSEQLGQLNYSIAAKIEN
jgi:hypothetical protein